MSNIVLQGQNLTPDYINVLRAILVDGICVATKLTKHPRQPQLETGFFGARGRAFHLLEAIDGAPYEPLYKGSEKISIFIRGALLDEEDAVLIGTALKGFHYGSANENVMNITGFSAKHFKNLVETMAVPLIDLLPPNDDDEPIPD